MPLGWKVGLKDSPCCLMHHRWESQSLLLSLGAHLLHIGWDVYQVSSDVKGSILLMFFLPSRTAILNFLVFAVNFLLCVWEANWGREWGGGKMHIHLSIEGTLFSDSWLERWIWTYCLPAECGPVVRGLNMFLLCKSSISHLPVKERIWENGFQE